MNTFPSLSNMPSLGSAVDSTAAATYTDVNGLAALKRDPNSPQAISAVAAQVEALFLQMMLKSMRDATASQDTDSNEMGMYQDMFDKQVALSISQHDDLGIARLLKRQLTPAAPGPHGAKAAGAAPGTPHAATAITSAADAASTADAGGSPAQFIERVMPAISSAAAVLGLNPVGLLAQAALESGWGKRMPRNADGSSSHNLFGIKAGEEWGGAKAAADTVEVSNGVATPRRASFRAYGSLEESIADFASLLKNSPRYRDAMAAGGDAQRYVQAMGASGYATDPGYANKLNQVLKSVALQGASVARMAKL